MTRRARNEQIRPDGPERVARIRTAELYAERVFGDRKRALKWLHAPKRHLDGETPLQRLATAKGARIVAEELVAIDEGYVA